MRPQFIELTFRQVKRRRRFGCALKIQLLLLMILVYPAVAQPVDAVAEPVSTITLVSVFPRSQDQQFKAALLSARGCKSARIKTVNTLGEPGVIAQLASRQPADGKSWFIFLDCSSAELMGPKLRSPAIIVTQSQELLTHQKEESWLKEKPYQVLETMPPPGAVLAAIKSLRPAPKRIGLIYNQSDPGNEIFVRQLGSDLKASLGPAAALVNCGLPPGACRNAAEVGSVLDKNLGSLACGDLLVALPGTNTLKFAFLITNQAEQRKLGLLSIGDFDPGNAMCHIAYPPPVLAEACWKALTRGVIPPGNARTIAIPGPPRSLFNRQAMEKLGYRSDLAR